MFIQGRSLAFSVLIHLLFFLFLIGYFAIKTPRTPLLPQKRVVSVSVRQNNSRPLSETVPLPPAGNSRMKENIFPPIEPREQISPPPRENRVEEQGKMQNEQKNELVPEQKNITEETTSNPPLWEQPSLHQETDNLPPIEEPFVKETSVRGTDYSYSLSEMPAVELPGEPVFLPGEDFSLDHLLIADSQEQEGTESLYSIELTGNRNREILSIPDLVFDSGDPVISTLSDCRISFSVTQEGLVRQIRMIEPGTGSETYDEILETLLSRFLFAPGEEETGTIGINFSRISGESHD